MSSASVVLSDGESDTTLPLDGTTCRYVLEEAVIEELEDMKIQTQGMIVAIDDNKYTRAVRGELERISVEAMVLVTTSSQPEDVGSEDVQKRLRDLRADFEKAKRVADSLVDPPPKKVLRRTPSCSSTTGDGNRADDNDDQE